MRDEQAKTDTTTEEIFSQRRLGSSVARHMVRDDGSGAAQKVHAPCEADFKKSGSVSRHNTIATESATWTTEKPAWKHTDKTVRETRW